MGIGTFDAGWNFLIATFPVKQKNLSGIEQHEHEAKERVIW